MHSWKDQLQSLEQLDQQKNLFQQNGHNKWGCMLVQIYKQISLTPFLLYCLIHFTATYVHPWQHKAKMSIQNLPVLHYLYFITGTTFSKLPVLQSYIFFTKNDNINLERTIGTIDNSIYNQGKYFHLSTSVFLFNIQQ